MYNKCAHLESAQRRSCTSINDAQTVCQGRGGIRSHTLCLLLPDGRARGSLDEPEQTQREDVEGSGCHQH